ncbi:hypothetical protein B0H14DRAFT_2620739 [Mycena olivaceomarginata]|nr:hypothetical protein B0H14DRAFT_2620739 [Mycena olivaceomarginata]
MVVDVDVLISFFQLEALLILLPRFKFISSSQIESPKKQQPAKPICIQIGITYGAQQAKIRSRVHSFNLNAIKFRMTAYIKIDYSVRQARTRCWCEAGPLGFMHRRTGLHRRAALRLAHRVKLRSVFGAITAAHELMGVGSWQRRTSLACSSGSGSDAHTRRLHDRALGSPHVALPDSRIVQGCALCVMHILHPFDPPRHKSSSTHCAARATAHRSCTDSSQRRARHTLLTPDLGPVVLGRRQMEEKGREKTERRDAVVSNAGVGSTAGVDLESVKKWRRHGSTAFAHLQCYKRSGLLARELLQEFDGRTNDRKSYGMTPPAKRGRAARAHQMGRSLFHLARLRRRLRTALEVKVG